MLTECDWPKVIQGVSMVWGRFQSWSLRYCSNTLIHEATLTLVALNKKVCSKIVHERDFIIWFLYQLKFRIVIECFFSFLSYKYICPMTRYKVCVHYQDQYMLESVDYNGNWGKMYNPVMQMKRHKLYWHFLHLCFCSSKSILPWFTKGNHE